MIQMMNRKEIIEIISLILVMPQGVITDSLRTGNSPLYHRSIFELNGPFCIGMVRHYHIGHSIPYLKEVFFNAVKSI